MACVVNSVIKSLIASVDVGEATKAVSIVDRILDMLLSMNLAYRMSIPPSLVGVHPDNRDGYGVSPVEVHALGADIVHWGWSWAACAHAVCFEDSADKKIAKYSSKLAEENPGLAPMLESIIKYGAVACTHTNQWLSAAIHGVATDEATLSVDGRMSHIQLGEADQLMKKAFTDGLQWTVIKSEVEVAYPELASVIQQARNAGNNIGRRESEIQILLRIQEAANRMVKDPKMNKTIDWELIRSRIIKRFPHNSSDVGPWVSFIKRWGGGVDGRVIANLKCFHQAFVKTGRTIPTYTFGILAGLKLKADELSPFAILAVVKAQAACPDAKVSNKVCRAFTQQEIQSLSGNRKSDMMAAEKILQQCHKLANSEGFRFVLDPIRPIALGASGHLY